MPFESWAWILTIWNPKAVIIKEEWGWLITSPFFSMLEQLNRSLPANRDKQKVALVDGDIIKYRIGFASQTNLYRLYLTEQVSGYEQYYNTNIPIEFEGKTALNNFIKEKELDPEFLYWEHQVIPDRVDKTLHSVKMTLERVQNVLQCDQIKIFLSGSNNFRENVATLAEYKGQRKELEKPYHYQEVHDYLVKYWYADVIDGMEADDALGIAQWQDFMKQKARYQNSNSRLDEESWLRAATNTYIVTLDKDLDMIPGWHFNWVAHDDSKGIDGQVYWISETEGLFNFFTQVLSGDSVDNIPGIRGIGQGKAKKALQGLTDPQTMYDKVIDQYINWVKSWKEQPDNPEQEAERRMDEAATLVWIGRTMAELGKVPYKTTYHMNVTTRDFYGQEDTAI